MTGTRFDLRSNQSFIKGAWKCRGELDLVLNSFGDLAIMPTEFDDLGQHILFWLAMPKGELVGSAWGSELVDWFHEPLTTENLGILRNRLKASLLTEFPNMQSQIVSVTTSKIDRGAIMIQITLTEGTLRYTFTEEEITRFTSELENLEVYYG